MARQEQHLGSIEKMRTFYDLFPYPGRPFIFQPNIVGSLLAHAGFSQLLARHDSAAAQAIWKALRSGSLYAPETQRQLSKYLPLLNDLFDVQKRVLLVGCGTDEPLLFHRLHPQNEIVGIDLSERALKLARRKLYFRGGKKNTFLIQGDASELLEHNRALGDFDHVQCFGVLHHQPDPEVLFRAIVKRMNPGGTLRIMIYSHKGRRLERRIQSRFDGLWENPVSGWRGNLKIRLNHTRLLLWQVHNLFLRRGAVTDRFRYLGVSPSSVADALLHPSDPGLPPEDLVKWANESGLQLVFCEAKVDSGGWVGGFDGPAAVWNKIVEADARDGLLSNIMAVFRKPA